MGCVWLWLCFTLTIYEFYFHRKIGKVKPATSVKTLPAPASAHCLREVAITLHFLVKGEEGQLSLRGHLPSLGSESAGTRGVLWVPQTSVRSVDKTPRHEPHGRNYNFLQVSYFTPTQLCDPALLISSVQFSSVQFSRSVVFGSLRPHESQHTRPPCPSPTPGVHSDSCPSSQ